MNYGEEIAYWYLRLNGFFPLTNFVIHRSSKIAYTSDCDVLAVRLPFVYEEIGGNPDDWDDDLADELGFDHFIGVICEVKTGAYNLDELFRPEYVKYSIGRLGFRPMVEIDDLYVSLNETSFQETEKGYRVCKLLIANEKKDSPLFFYKSLNDAEDFIENRVRKYSNEKYADRMYFGSELLQHTIHRMHREREKRRDQKAKP